MVELDSLNKMPETPVLDVVRVVTIQDGKVLLVKEFDDENWKLPGGKTHEGETILQAVQREIHEELGFLISPEQIKNYAKKTIPHSEHFRHIVLAEITDDQIQETKEVVERSWVDKDNIPPGKFQEHITSAVQFVT